MKIMSYFKWSKMTKQQGTFLLPTHSAPPVSPIQSAPYRATSYWLIVVYSIETWPSKADAHPPSLNFPITPFAATNVEWMSPPHVLTWLRFLTIFPSTTNADFKLIVVCNVLNGGHLRAKATPPIPIFWCLPFAHKSGKTNDNGHRTQSQLPGTWRGLMVSNAALWHHDLVPWRMLT
jgi:hypothetical protein